jgi:hypothetical protein
MPDPVMSSEFGTAAAEAGNQAEDNGLVPVVERWAQRALAGMQGKDKAENGSQGCHLEERVRTS